GGQVRPRRAALTEEAMTGGAVLLEQLLTAGGLALAGVEVVAEPAHDRQLLLRSARLHVAPVLAHQLGDLLVVVQGQPADLLHRHLGRRKAFLLDAAEERKRRLLAAEKEVASPGADTRSHLLVARQHR